MATILSRMRTHRLLSLCMHSLCADSLAYMIWDPKRLQRSPDCGLCMMAPGALGCTATAPLHLMHYRHMAALKQLPAGNVMSSASDIPGRHCCGHIHADAGSQHSYCHTLPKPEASTCEEVTPASDAAVTSCLSRQGATSCPSLPGRTGPTASASQPVALRMSSTYCCTPQALQTLELFTATSLLSRSSS